jgi:hypothetical protein
MHTKFLVKKLKGGDHLVDLGMNERKNTETYFTGIWHASKRFWQWWFIYVNFLDIVHSPSF